MNRIQTSLLLIALFLSLAPTALASATWYVNGMSGSDGNACSSPTNACKTIGHAISLASSGDSTIVSVIETPPTRSQPGYESPASPTPACRLG